MAKQSENEFDVLHSSQGVVPLYQPHGQVKGRIFAFHSPGYNRLWETSRNSCDVFSVTRSSTQPQSTVNWLQELLPKNFPHCAIYSVSHETCWYLDEDNPGYDPIYQVIERYLTATPLKERAPIAFIVQGLGGLYLQQVINMLWGPNGSFKSFTPELDRLSGVVFLGTPQIIPNDVLPDDWKMLHTDSVHETIDDVRKWRDDLHRIDRAFKDLLWCRGLTAIFVPPEGTPPMKTIGKEEFENKSGAQENCLECPPGMIARETTVQTEPVEVWKELRLDGHCELISREKRQKRYGARSGVIITEASTYSHPPTFSSDNTPYFEKMCSWVERALGHQLGDKAEWEMMGFPLERKSPFGSAARWYYPFESSVNKLRNKEIPVTNPSQMEAWVHFPINSLSKMEKAMNFLAPSCFASKNFPKTLGTVGEGRSKLPHSRYVIPKFKVFSGQGNPRVTHVQICLPYVHWDTLDSAHAYMEDIKNANSRQYTSKITGMLDLAGLLKSPNRPSSFSQVTQKRNDPLPSLDATFHPRRTLDQFSNCHLNDTSSRDRDQVVWRQTRNEPGNGNVIMVDQLWLCLWIVEGEKNNEWDYRSSGVLSAFPHTSYTRSDKTYPNLFNVGDVRQAVLEQLEKSQPISERLNTFEDFELSIVSEEQRGNYVSLGRESNAPRLASSILSTAISGTLSINNEPSLKFLELFREAIMEKSETYCEQVQNFTISQTTTQEANQKDMKSTQRRKGLLLAIEVTDILDELGMLKKLFETQGRLLRKGLRQMHEVQCLQVLRATTSSILETIEDEYLVQVESMEKDVLRLQRSLLDFLDLQQKEASIDEAKYANQQALFAARQALAAQAQTDATEAQSQILLVFTVVTIVFLPLGFLTSYYGMNIIGGLDSDGKIEQKNYQLSNVQSTFGKACGGIAALLVMSWIWYRLVKAHIAYRSAEDLRAMVNRPRGLESEYLQAVTRVDKGVASWSCPHCWLKAWQNKQSRIRNATPQTVTALVHGETLPNVTSKAGSPASISQATGSATVMELNTIKGPTARIWHKGSNEEGKTGDNAV